ncbi:insulinase family protein [Actinoplanes sp. NPDC024001]|uniref:insulinase family protein n=1 Tax=Actinoplanes sp. NPDC024001 TaxID=3154598 RepID=UPI0033CFD2F8
MIRQLEVDGVPTLLAPVSGPMHAGLVFRVGLADETPARRGITHLVEHLVLPGPAQVSSHLNSRTGIEHTYFHVQGSAERITGFLAEVCAALRRLPVDRLDGEKEILRSEAEGRVSDPLPMRRHGARDFGMPSYPEWGLDGLAAEHLHEWIARYFTRDNAALWVAGDELPEGLALDLPDGARQPAPAPSSALAQTPAAFTGAGERAAWDTVVRREARAAVFANVLERQLDRDLCRRSAIAAAVRTEYQPRAARTARITAFAEPLAGHRDAALGGLVDALAALQAGRVEADDVTTVVELTCDGLREAEERGGRLPGQAFNVLAGLSVRGLDDAIAEVRAVTAAEVAEVATAAYGAGLLMTPAGTHAGWAGYPVTPAESVPVSAGRVRRARGDRKLRLVHGDEGVSVVAGETVRTVRYDACAALLAWPDGARELIGDDGITVRVEPTLFRDGAVVTAEIDAHVPAAHRITMPAREPGSIPAPRRRLWAGTLVRPD